MFKTYETNMVKMGEKILEKARWDGGWPRAVCMGMGNIVLAKDQEHYDQLVNKIDRVIIFISVVAILFLIFFVFLFFWCV